MKKLFSLAFIFISFCTLFAGCEGGNLLRTASFSNITMAGSQDYTIKISFAEDERVDNRYYDIQIKADGAKKIKIGKEFEKKKEAQLSESWQSLTTLLLDEANTETFVKGSEAVTVIYIFNTEEESKITFRVVVGGIEDNASGTGKIITSPEDCSDEFVVKTK